LHDWGFTTIGAWSEHQTLRAAAGTNFFFTPVLHLGSTAGAPWWDMWDEKVIRRMDDGARNQILPWRGERRVIGYYSDNEMGWWNATLFKMTLEQAPGSGQRRRLLQLLRKTYQNDWGQLLKDFDAENAGNWRQLEKAGMLYLKPGGNGIRVMRAFLELLAERYYQLVRELIHKYDPKALVLGDRYQSFFYPEVVRAAGRSVDAISSNLNASWNDGTYLRSYLQTLHQLTGKPVLVSEVYMAAAENRSGNRNNMGVFPVVPTQAERVQSIRNTMLALARTPYVVGIDWFQYYDEPRHGREDGENFNFGLVDIEDRPYAELTGGFRSLALEGYRTGSPSIRTDVSGGVPPAPAEPFAEFAPMRALKNWDRERGYVKPVVSSAPNAPLPVPVADLYVCWSPRALYVGVYALDIIEEAYYRDRSVPKQDRPLWQLEMSGAKPFSVRLGAGREPIASDPSIRIEHLSALNLNVRNIAAVELPAAWLGRSSFKPGDRIEFSSTLRSHGRAYQTQWKAELTLAEK
jgi:hypothetical protein